MGMLEPTQGPDASGGRSRTSAIPTSASVDPNPADPEETETSSRSAVRDVRAGPGLAQTRPGGHLGRAHRVTICKHKDHSHASPQSACERFDRTASMSGESVAHGRHSEPNEGGGGQASARSRYARYPPPQAFRAYRWRLAGHADATYLRSNAQGQTGWDRSSPTSHPMYALPSLQISERAKQAQMVERGLRVQSTRSTVTRSFARVTAV
jgi:hypothetical protein